MGLRLPLIWTTLWLGKESDLSRRMKPSFGWRGCRYAKDGHILLLRLEGMSLPPFCKHCRNLGLGRCLQEASRHVPDLHPKRWAFLRVI